MQPSEIINVVDNVGLYIAAVIFAVAAFRAITIGRALVIRVYRTQAYFTAALAILEAGSILLNQSDKAYAFLLVIMFVLVDVTILVALQMDFFHRNTLRWKQVRLVAYGLLVATFILTGITGNASHGHITGGLSFLNALYTFSGTIYIAYAFIVFIFAYPTAAAVVSARRTPDKPLRRFMALAGLFLFGLLINTLVFTLVTVVFSPFFFIAFAYITYRMAMSLSPVGRVKKEAV